MGRQKPRAHNGAPRKTSRTPHPEAVDSRESRLELKTLLTGERERKRLCFFPLDFQGQHNLFLVIEAGDSSSRGLGAILFGVDFVIDIGIKATEAVIAFVISDVAAHVIGASIFQEDNGRSDL